jgi:hypothetical protein
MQFLEHGIVFQRVKPTKVSAPAAVFVCAPRLAPPAEVGSPKRPAARPLPTANPHAHSRWQSGRSRMLSSRNISSSVRMMTLARCSSNCTDWTNRLQTTTDFMKTRKIAPIHPGEILLHDFMEPLGLSQYALAKALGVTHAHQPDCARPACRDGGHSVTPVPLLRHAPRLVARFAGPLRPGDSG